MSYIFTADSPEYIPLWIMVNSLLASEGFSLAKRPDVFPIKKRALQWHSQSF
jgi:hypothetical protein